MLSLPGGLVFLEVDENQHLYGYDASISCDMKSMDFVMGSLFDELGEARPNVYWLRYNPSAYHVDGVLVKVQKEERERRLVISTRRKPRKKFCTHVVTCACDHIPQV